MFFATVFQNQILEGCEDFDTVYFPIGVFDSVDSFSKFIKTRFNDSIEILPLQTREDAFLCYASRSVGHGPLEEISILFTPIEMNKPILLNDGEECVFL